MKIFVVISILFLSIILLGCGSEKSSASKPNKSNESTNIVTLESKIQYLKPTPKFTMNADELASLAEIVEFQAIEFKDKANGNDCISKFISHFGDKFFIYQLNDNSHFFGYFPGPNESASTDVLLIRGNPLIGYPLLGLYEIEDEQTVELFQNKVIFKIDCTNR